MANIIPIKVKDTVDNYGKTLVSLGEMNSGDTINLDIIKSDVAGVLTSDGSGNITASDSITVSDVNAINLHADNINLDNLEVTTLQVDDTAVFNNGVNVVDGTITINSNATIDSTTNGIKIDSNEVEFTNDVKVDGNVELNNINYSSSLSIKNGSTDTIVLLTNNNARFGDTSMQTNMEGGSITLTSDTSTIVNSAESIELNSPSTTITATDNYINVNQDDIQIQGHSINIATSTNYINVNEETNLINGDTVFQNGTASFFEPVNIENNLKVRDYIELNSSSLAPAWKEGRLFWDSVNHTLAQYNNDSNITQQLGQELFVYVVNKSGVNILNGQVVRIKNSTGEVPSIELAIAGTDNGVSTEKNTILGVATHDININQNGYVTTFGMVNGLNTNAFTEGDVIYLSNTSSGSFTATLPTSPYDVNKVGIVVKKAGGNGSIFVNVIPAMHINDIGIMNVVSSSVNDVLKFNGTSYVNSPASQLTVATASYWNGSSNYVQNSSTSSFITNSQTSSMSVATASYASSVNQNLQLTTLTVNTSSLNPGNVVTIKSNGNSSSTNGFEYVNSANSSIIKFRDDGQIIPQSVNAVGTVYAGGGTGYLTANTVGHNLASGIFQVGGFGNGGQLALYSSGSERVRIDASGNMTLSSSLAKFTVQGSGSAEGRVVLSSLGGSAASIEIQSPSGGTICKLDDGNSAFRLISATNYPITFNPAGTERMRLTPSGSLGIGITTPSASLHVSGTARMGGTNDYTSFENDGTMLMVGSASVYNDFPPVLLSMARSSGTTPALTIFTGSIYLPLFQVNDEVHAHTEVMHWYKQGTDVEMHIHWATGGTDADNRGVKWQLDYTIANENGTFSAPVTLTVEKQIVANTPAHTYYISSFGTIPGASITVGASIIWRLLRIPSVITANAPSTNPYGITVGAHAEMDTLGSRTISSK